MYSISTGCVRRSVWADKLLYCWQYNRENRRERFSLGRGSGCLLLPLLKVLNTAGCLDVASPGEIRHELLHTADYKMSRFSVTWEDYMCHDDCNWTHPACYWEGVG